MTVPPTEVIRPMQRSDLKTIVAVEQLSNPHPWSSGQFLSELDNSCSVIELLCLDDKIAAFLCSWLVVDELHIHNVATHPDYRRQGLALKLMTRRAELAKNSGAVVALLEVRAHNTGAIRLYERLGYRQNGRRRRYYADGEDAVLMECDLTA
ncbi:MAG: ribosomal protein S18-alanine N-acetyltransferase [Desulfuromonadales bacterium]|nr:ribosomal protein S18-alanine N-acetyltransferase [Desulfuromonadales bacterium]